MNFGLNFGLRKSIEICTEWLCDYLRKAVSHLSALRLTAHRTRI
ncbi:MAG: hypothetical protein Ct9H300mP21_11350 [Pseudomonadota bacterium]|nr:MAG: hypothetical protein Ct9H300mP21_11350 [Pseudomonadota bacterium]